MRHVLKDSSFIILSIALAIVIGRLDLIEKLLSLSENVRVIGAFVGGLFFTSVFTTAPAIIFLGEIGQVEPILVVALIGAAGAVCGDILLFHLFKNHVAKDVDTLIGLSKNNLLKNILHNRAFRWVGILVGALIISSLPDELGIALMGLTKMEVKSFIPVSFTFNFFGIYLIGLASRLLT